MTPTAADRYVPFFIVGFQRSGTTLLRMMLDSHPDIAIPLDVTGLWPRYETRLEHYGTLEVDTARRRLVTDLLQEDRIRLWELPHDCDEILANWTRPGFAGAMEAFYRSYADARGKRLWGDKEPGNMLRIDQLDRWFPGCRIIHIIRDGRDACTSQLRQTDFGYDDVLPCADAWREQVWWVRSIGRLLGERRYCELLYERLVEDPERVLRRLCDFIDVPFSASMLSYHRRVKESIPESKRQLWPLIGEPPQSDRVAAWRREMSAGRRVAFEKRAGGLLRELGYETLPGRPSGGYVEEARSLVRTALAAVRRRLSKR